MNSRSLSNIFVIFLWKVKISFAKNRPFQVHTDGYVLAIE
jgi:hypothetical protein